MRFLFVIFFFIKSLLFYGQHPFYYKIKTVEGCIYENDSNKIKIKFISRNKLSISNCNNPDLETFLKTLTLTRLSRKYLEHLITSSAKITVIISDKVGIMKKDGKYRLMAGHAGPGKHQSDSLITDSTSNLRNKKDNQQNWVYKENQLELFKGSLLFANKAFKLSANNVIIFDYDKNEPIKNFDLDTIKIEPLMNPDMLYKNNRELYYFAGIHEIFHLSSQNIRKQINGEDAETDAYILESKAFKKRKKINRKAQRKGL